MKLMIDDEYHDVEFLSALKVHIILRLFMIAFFIGLGIFLSIVLSIVESI